MRLVLASLFVTAFGTQLTAASVCSFDRECLEAEACTDTNVDLERTSASGDVVTMITDAETLEGQMIASDDNLHFVFEGPSAAHLLTEYPDGAARYTIHMDGPFTITYHGQCEEAG